MLIEEKIIVENLSGWIARNENGTLFIYAEKPQKNIIGSCWTGEGIWINPELFKFITWNHIPVNTEELKKRKENYV